MRREKEREKKREREREREHEFILKISNLYKESKIFLQD